MKRVSIIDQMSEEDIRLEIEADLRRALLGSQHLDKPMLTYLLSMAVSELSRDESRKDWDPSKYFVLE